MEMCLLGKNYSFRTSLLKAKFHYLLLLLCPLTFLFVGLNYASVYKNISQVDPDYVYLFSFLRIIHLNTPTHIDHPGLSYDFFGAAIIKAYNFFTNKPDLDAVIRNPTFYLYIVRVTTVCFSAFLYFILGVLAYFYSRRISTAFILELSPFFLPLFMPKTLGVNIESFLLILMPFLTIFLLIAYYRKELLSKRVFVSLFALPFALLVTAKITTILLLFIPMLLLPNWRQRFCFILAFTFFSLLIFMPAVPRIRHMLSWMWALMLHTGIYGSGEKVIVDISTYPHNIISLLLYLPSLYFLSLGALLFSLLLKKTNRARLFILSLVFTQFLGLFLVAKHFYHHYMMPFLFLSAFLIYLFFEILLDLRKNKKKWASMALCVATLCLLFMLNSNYERTGHELNWQKKRILEYSSLKNKIEKDYALCAQIHSLGSLDKSVGLYWGLWPWGDKNYRYWAPKYYWEKLQELYGKNNKYFPSVWSSNYSNFYEAHIPFTKIRRKHSCVIHIHTGLELPEAKLIYDGSFFKVHKYK